MHNRGIVGFVLLVAFCAAPAIAADMNADALRAGLAQCRRLPSVTDRAACYDRLADSQSNMAVSSAAPAPPAPPAPMTSSTTYAAPASVLPASPASAPPVPPPVVAQTTASLVSGDVGKILVPLASSSTYGDHNMLVMKFADGSEWVQADDNRIKTWPKIGDVIEIRKSLAGYWCDLNKRDVFHCRPRLKSDR